MDPNLRRLGLGTGVRMLGNALYNPFLALFLVNELRLGYADVGLLIAGIGLVLLPFNLLGGLLTDRIGRKPLLVLGLVAEALATAGLAVAFAEHSLPFAVAAALAGGIVVTVAGPAAAAYIADFAEGSERTRGFTFYRIGFNAGYSAGVAVGGLLIAEIGYAGTVGAATFVIAGGAVFLGLALAPSPADRELAARRRSGGDPAAADPPPEFASGRTVSESFGLIARDRVAREVFVAVALAAVVVGQWSITFPLYVHNVLGIPYDLLGVGLALNGLIVVLGQSPTTERAVGHRHTTLAVAGLALYAVAFLGLGAAGLFGTLLPVAFFASVVVLTFGENLITIPQATLPSNLAPPGETGAYNGAFAMVGALGFLVSALLGGVVLALTANPLAIWAILLLPAVPSGVLFRDAARRLTPVQDRA